MDIDIDGLRGWIGRTEESEDLLTARLAAEFRATFAPHLAPVPDGEAALGLHWCLSPAIRPLAELGPDGHPRRGGFLPPVPLPRRMWAGGEVELVAPLRVGDRVLRRSRIGDVSLKQGRTGALVFVAVHHEYETPRGLAIRERHDIVYRDAEAIETRPDPPPAGGGGRREAPDGGGRSAGLPTPDRAFGATRPSPAGEGSQASSASAAPSEPNELPWTVETSPIFLFRYSAITFNGHRIHYDLPYVTAVEGYRGLVVHGPIQATLLLNAAAALSGRAPERFSYRGLSPLTAGPPFRVNAADEAGGGRAWTESAEGRLCMEATAAFSAG